MLAVAALVPGAAAQGVAVLPTIVGLMAPPRLPVGVSGEIRVAYRAPSGNVVAVVQAIEDLDGPVDRQATRQREFGVVARAFGREAGELVLPLAFATAGLKRVVLTLITDEREESASAAVEVLALP